MAQAGLQQRGGQPAPAAPSLLLPGDARGFTPASLSGLVLWLDAARVAQPDNTPVATWLDQSGQGNHATQATAAAQPTYLAAGAAGKPAVAFDGVDDKLVISTGATSRPTWTIVAVVAYAAPQSGQQPVFSNRSFSPQPPPGGGGASLYFGNGGSASAEGGFAFMSNVTPSGLNGTTAITGIAVVALVVAATNRTLYRDGTQEAQDAAVAATVLPWGAVGWDTLPNWYSQSLCELDIYNRALTASERTALHRYLGQKWGVRVP